MKLILEIWNWMNVYINGGVGYVLPLTYGSLDNLSVLEVVYLFRNICFGLSVEDSYDCCKNGMRIRWIETNLVTVVIEYDRVLIHCICMIFESRNEMYSMFGRWKRMDSIELSWPVCPGWKSQKSRVYMGADSRRRNFSKMINWSICVMVILIS